MTTLFLGFEQGLMRVDVNGSAKADWVLKVPTTFSVAVDPVDPKYVYATSIGHGVFRSEDGGRSFEPSEGLPIMGPQLVWSSSVSPTERTKDGGVVYVGTMPSAVFRSEDGGRTFQECKSLQEVETLKEAAFPPTPATHAIHMIANSFNRPDTVFVGVELGGIIRSSDGGETWEAASGAGPDCHQLLAHPMAPDRLYESAGEGYIESFDNGDTWKVGFEGIDEDLCYFYDMAVDPGDPDNLMVSVGRNQYQAHGLNPYSIVNGVFGDPFARDNPITGTYSTLWRRKDGNWSEMLDGLPHPDGHEQGRFATALGDDKGTLYYVTIPGQIHRTTDGGDSWSQIDTEYPSDVEHLALHVARAVKD